MRVFLSSTCYDLEDLRAELEVFLKRGGHEPVLSDRSSFSVNPGIHRHRVCVDRVKECELYILVLDRRFGADYYEDSKISVSWAEYKNAVKNDINLIVFVRNSVDIERQTYKKNKKAGNNFIPFYVDDVRTFEFIDEIQKHESGTWIQPFINTIDIKKLLDNMEIFQTKNKPHIADDKNSIHIRTLSELTKEYLESRGLAENGVTTVAGIENAVERLDFGAQPYGPVTNFEPLPASDKFITFAPIRTTGNGQISYTVYPTPASGVVLEELSALVKEQRGHA